MTLQWIAVRPSLYEETPIVDFQALNDPRTPLATLEVNNVEKQLVEICYRIKRALVEGERAPIKDSAQRASSASDVDPRRIHAKLLELGNARRQRDAFLAKNDEEIQRILRSGDPIEQLMLKFMFKLHERLEEFLKYDVALLATIETIRNSGSDPRTYDLPSFDEALADFRSRTMMHGQYSSVLTGIQESLLKMLATSTKDAAQKK